MPLEPEHCHVSSVQAGAGLFLQKQTSWPFASSNPQLSLPAKPSLTHRSSHDWFCHPPDWHERSSLEPMQEKSPSLHVSEPVVELVRRPPPAPAVASPAPEQPITKHAALRRMD